LGGGFSLWLGRLVSIVAGWLILYVHERVGLFCSFLWLGMFFLWLGE
jgi:hypothetical protein